MEMSFLRALRAYIGLGPDDEIEDRYLSELNARRRELALDEIGPDRHTSARAGRGGRSPTDDSGQRDHPLDHPDRSDERHGDPTDDDVLVRPARAGAGSRRRSRVAGLVGLDEAGRGDDLDLPALDEDGTSRPSGRHDIEPDAALETIVGDDGVDTVRVRARSASGHRAVETTASGHRAVETTASGHRAVETTASGHSAVEATASGHGAAVEAGSAEDEGGVVRSLDSMRAKPRTLLPESFADAKLVADEFKRDIPVVLNLQAVERDLARRLIDFSSGICYVRDGSMEKIASQVFLLIPASVEVTEEDRRRIEERGYAR